MSKQRASDAGAATATKHRKIQLEQDKRDRSKGESKDPKSQGSGSRSPKAQDRESEHLRSGQRRSAPAGAREQPKALPAQHLEKPGNESELQLRPRFLAPEYIASHKLRGMVAMVTGGDSGIGRAIAVLFAREGADIGIVYLSEHADALETKRYVEAEGRRCVLLAGDVKHSAFCQRAVRQVVRELGRPSVDASIRSFGRPEPAADDR